MRTSPSIAPVPTGDVYLVLDDFGRMGCAWRETNVKDTDLDAITQDLVRVIAFNLSEGWVRNASEEIAQKLRQQCADEGSELPESLHQFVEQAVGA